MAPADTVAKYMTVAECATAAGKGTGKRTIYAAIRSGRLRAAVINGRGDLRVHPDWFRAWVESCATPAPACSTAERQQVASASGAANGVNGQRIRERAPHPAPCADGIDRR